MQNVHGKRTRKIFLQIFLQNNAQYRYFVAAISSWPISLLICRYRLKVPIFNNFGNICGTKCTLLADITSVHRKPTLNQYLKWLGNFNLMPIPNRNCQYLNMPMKKFGAYGSRKYSMLIFASVIGS